MVCWLLSAAGVICILVAHEHYTVDVIVAYYITTRLFWWYHSMANEKVSGAAVLGASHTAGGQFHRRDSRRCPGCG